MAWGQAIAQTVGGAGNEYGRATDANINTALAVIQNKLMMQEVQQRLRESDQRMKEQDLRMKQMQSPAWQYFSSPHGGTVGLQTNPLTGAPMGQPQTIVSGEAPPPKDPKQLFAEALQKEDYETAQKIIDMIGKEYQVEHPDKPKPDSANTEKRAQAEKDAEALGFKRGSPQWLKKVIELTNPAAAKVTFKLPSGGASALPNVPNIPNQPASATGAVPENPVFAALQKQNPNMAALVKQIADYQINPQTLSNRGGHREQILGLVSRIDPTYDQTQYNARSALRKDFTSGAASKNIRSLNTAVSHLYDFYNAANALNNAPYPLWNAIANKGLKHTGDPRVAAFNTAADAVEGEMATVFKGTSGTDQEIKQWRNNLDSSMSPAQIKASVTELIGLMGGRLGALDAQWTSGMGKPRDFSIISPSSRKLLERMGQKGMDEQAAPMSGDVSTLPPGAQEWTPPQPAKAH